MTEAVPEMVLSAIWRAAIGRDNPEQAAWAEEALNATGNVPRQAATVAGAAAWYANRGMRVFPLQPGLKQPYKGTHGVKDATADVVTLAAWFHPSDTHKPNLAVACGHPFDVLDIDTETGAKSFIDNLGDGAWLDMKGVTETPRGMHIWVPAVEGAKNIAGAEGFDRRGKGGYVVVPPSHINGTLYRWLLPPVR